MSSAKTEYEPFADFLKANCIFVVIFYHVFSYLKEIAFSWSNTTIHSDTGISLI